MPKPINVEQVERHLEEIAGMMGAYYRSLVMKGVPSELAYKLVEGFNNQLFKSSLDKPAEIDGGGVENGDPD